MASFKAGSFNKKRELSYLYKQIFSWNIDFFLQNFQICVTILIIPDRELLKSGIHGIYKTVKYIKGELLLTKTDLPIRKTKFKSMKILLLKKFV